MESFVSAIFGETKVPGLLIGDIVASHISLQMRSGHISVLWTSPLIFATTLRLKLDPSSRFSDDELWQVLHSVGLGDWAMGLNKRLGAVLYHQTMTEECKQVACLYIIRALSFSFIFLIKTNTILMLFSFYY